MVYQKTNWTNGMVISSASLNKLEEGVNSISLDNESINYSLAQIGAVPETFANLAALQSTYHNGKTGLFVTADNGHKYIWVNGTWTDAGVYQSVGISDASITPEKLTTSYVPNNKKLRNFGLLSGSTNLYIINDVISKSGIVNVTGKFSAGSVVIFLLEKNDTIYTVKGKYSTTVAEGWQSLPTNFYVTGNGNEYIGVVASVYYSQTGGNGFYNVNRVDVNAEHFNTSQFMQNYDFPIFSVYENIEIVEKLEKTTNKVNNLSLPTIELSDYLTPKYSVVSDSIGFVGRWFDTKLNGVPVKATINEGSELYFKVKNTTTINVNFVLNSVKATPFFAYSIDGSPMTRQLITNPLLPAVNTSEHIVRVVIDGLTETEDKWIGEKGIAFKDVTVDTGGIVTGIVPKNRKIIFHGDSITEGIRVLNTNADSTGNSATGSYPYIACTNLNAISYRVGFGGSGITKGGSGGVPELIQVIDKMTNVREAPYIEPDVVVMNMGTNDSASTSDNFTQKLNAVLDRFTIKYSGTPIFIMVPFNQARKTELTSAVSARSNMYLVETAGWNVTTTDGTHPDIAGGLVAGQKLANAIISVMGKDFFI